MILRIFFNLTVLCGLIYLGQQLGINALVIGVVCSIIMAPIVMKSFARKTELFKEEE